MYLLLLRSQIHSPEGRNTILTTMRAIVYDSDHFHTHQIIQ